MPETVMTVNGEIDLDSLGTTLMHEHIYANNSGWWHCPSCEDRMDLANSNVNMNILGELRMDPFVNKVRPKPNPIVIRKRRQNTSDL